MKKLLRFSILFFLINALLVCVVESEASFFSKFTKEQKAEFNQAMAQLNTPEKVTEWLTENFTYDREFLERVISTKYRSHEDFWEKAIKLPIETYYDRKGICHDAANLAGYALSKAGYKVAIVTSFFKISDRIGCMTHTVCAFQRDGKWWVCADTRARKSKGEKGVRNVEGPFNTIKEIAVYICNEPDNLKDYDTYRRKKGF